MNVFISGIGGFLGSNLAHHFLAEGHVVSGTTHRALNRIAGVRVVHQWRLGMTADPAWLSGSDVVVHCAHDFAATADANIAGTCSMAAAARSALVPKQVLVSSLSARPDAESSYGRAKYAMEQQLSGDDLIIVRPGTVIGNGGVFGRMCELVRKLPVLPLIGGGTSRMYLIGLSDLCLAMARIIERGPPATFNLYYAETMSLKDVLIRVRRLMQRRTWLVPMPISLALAASQVASLVGLRLPIDVDNVRGFQRSQIQHHESDLLRVINRAHTVDEALQDALGSAAVSVEG